MNFYLSIINEGYLSKNKIFSRLKYSERDISNSITTLREMEKRALANSPQEVALYKAINILQEVSNNYYDLF